MFGSPPKPWVGRRHVNMESMFEYGARAGFWHLWRLFTERDLKATVLQHSLDADAPSRADRRHESGRLGNREPRS